MSRTKAPPGTDPYWAALAAPLLVYLETPRTWDELALYRKGQKVPNDRLRNLLAYLEDEKAVMSFYRGKVLYWSKKLEELPEGTSFRRPAGGSDDDEDEDEAPESV